MSDGRRKSLHATELAYDVICRRCGETEHVLVKPSGPWSTHVRDRDPMLSDRDDCCPCCDWCGREHPTPCPRHDKEQR